jgi:hypothetical protein
MNDDSEVTVNAPRSVKHGISHVSHALKVRVQYSASELAVFELSNLVVLGG